MIKEEKIIYEMINAYDNKNFDLVNIKIKEGISLLGETKYFKILKSTNEKKASEIKRNRIKKIKGEILISNTLNAIDNRNFKQANTTEKEGISLLGKSEYYKLFNIITIKKKKKITISNIK